MGKYSDLFEDNTGPKAAINLIQGVDEKPDAVADEVKLARRYNLPVDMIKFYKPEYDSRAKADDALDNINNNPVLKSWLAADQVRAKMTHDDLPTLGGMEHAVNYVFGAGNDGALGVDALRSLASSVPALGASMYGVAASGAGLVGATGVENWLLDAQKKSDGFADWVAGVDGNASYIRRMVRNAFQSVGETLVSLPLGMERGLLNLSKTAAEAFVPGVFGVSEFGSAYGKGREQGLSPQASTTYAAENAAYEYLFERYFGETGFLKKLAAGERPSNLFKYELTRELPGELATTLGQNFNEWLNVNPDKPFSQFLEEQPQDLIDTAVSTLIGGGAQIGIGRAVQHAVYSDALRQQRAQAGERSAQIMSRMSALAAASKTLDRDPTTFESYAKDLTDGTPAESFFVDANVLHQSGVGDMLAQAIPEVAEQYNQALQTGGLVQVPTAEFLSKFGKSDVPDQLVDHVKFDPQDMSRAESMEFFQSGQAEQLKNDLERLVDKHTEDDAFQQSADAVRENVRAQLEAAGRRPDVANAYADLWKAYFSVTAAKLGTTPEALFNKRPATITSSIDGGQVLNQNKAATPVATITGAEIAPKDTDIKTLREAARAWYNTNLRDKGPVVNEASGREVKFENAGKAFSTSANPDKLRLFAALREIVSKGDIVSSRPPIDPKAEMNTKAYHWLVATVHLDGKPVPVGVTLREDNRGNLYYNHNPIKEKVSPTPELGDTAHKAGAGTSEGETFEQSIDQADNDINLHLLSQGQKVVRGSFNPSTNVISLLQHADLSTFLHESGHYFLEMQFQLASRLALSQSQGESLTQGEQEFLADNQKLLDWMAQQDHVKAMSEIEGNAKRLERLAQDNPEKYRKQAELAKAAVQWANERGREGYLKDVALTWGRDVPERLQFYLLTPYHEYFARGFEAYLFEGKSPSVELHGIFQKFRSWLLDIYKSIKNLNVQLTDEVRSVFDRMLATNEEIQTAERARSMMPLFDSAQSAGMSEAEFAEYQNLDVQRSLDAIDELQAKALRDMQWARRARSRVIRQLQNQSKELRREATMDASREVMSQPVYQAWQFLKRKLSDNDKLAAPDGNKSDPKVLDETKDSLFTAIAKLGGLDKSEVIGTWGTDPADKPNSGVFGSPVWRVKDGRTIDDMAQALGEAGYLSLDEHGKVDLREFEERFDTELRGNPQFSAFYIPDGEFMPGSQVQNSQSIEAGRIDLAALYELDLPKEVEDRIKSLRMTAKTGWHPDFLAERFGFTSGDEMVRALAAATPPREAIANRAQEIMQAEHGELATPEAIEREADKAVSNESRARMIAMEMDALQQALGGREDTGRTDKKGRAIKRSILPAQAKAVASQMIGRLKIRNIKPGQYTAADTRAGKAAEKALKEGNQLQAYTEKRNQMISTYAARQAFEALDEVDAGLRYLRGLAKMNSKTIDMGYMEQIENLLSKFDLQNKSLVQIDKRTSLSTWLQSQINQGIMPEIDPAVFLSPEALAQYYRDINALDESGSPINTPEKMLSKLGDLIEQSKVRSYKDVTLDEFRGLVDTVKQLEHLGRTKKTLFTEKQRREFEAVRDEIVSRVREHAGDRSVNNRTEVNNFGEKKQSVLGFLGSHIKASTIARVLDGGQDGGPMWEYFIRPANERGSMETTMRGEATQALAKIMEPVIKAGKMGGKGKFIASVGRSFNREQQFAVALNMGNEGNMQRLMDGEGWTADQVHDIVAGLTADDWKAVQQVWDHLESYWPLIEAKEKRVYGKAPNKIEVRPLTVVTAFGEALTLKGGYYPVKYDPRASQRAEAFDEAENAKAMMKAAYTSSTTRRSFTKDRAERVVGRPLLLSLSTLYNGVNEIIHDLAQHEFLIDANRLLSNPSIDSAIRGHYGADVVKQLRDWINDIAAGDKKASHAGDVAASYFRRSVSIAGLGFNIMSALMQPIGITQSMVRVGYGWIGHGIQQFIGSPLETTRMVQEKSEFMRNRFSTQIRELAELKNRVQGQNKVNQFIGDYGYLLMTRAQQVVDVPTWVGAYNKALSEGNDDERASALADQAVIDSQGNGETKDLAAIERGSVLNKMMTVFYSFMNTALNVAAGKAMTEKSKGKLAVDMLMVYSVPVVLGMLLKSALTPSGGGGDDDESLAKKLAVAHLDFFMSQFVYVREFSAAAHIMFGDGGGVQGYSGPSGFRMVADATQFAAQANQGEFDDQFRKSAINLLGDFAGLPSAQINRTITGFNALRDGETHNPLALVAGYKK